MSEEGNIFIFYTSEKAFIIIARAHSIEAAKAAPNWAARPPETPDGQTKRQTDRQDEGWAHGQVGVASAKYRQRRRECDNDVDRNGLARV